MQTNIFGYYNFTQLFVAIRLYFRLTFRNTSLLQSKNQYKEIILGGFPQKYFFNSTRASKWPEINSFLISNKASIFGPTRIILGKMTLTY